MYVEFNQRYLGYRAGDRTDKIGRGVAVELIKRRICKEVSGLKKRGRPRKHADSDKQPPSPD